jgi:hypothetical protein
MRGMRAVSLLPVAKQWGGEPLEERWRGHEEAAAGPSTISLRAMVPVPTSCARREEC